MAVVKVPAVLRPSTNGEREVRLSGSNVGEVLRALTEMYPVLASELFNRAGGLNRYIGFYLNEEEVSTLQGLGTPVGENDTILIVPPRAGG